MSVFARFQTISLYAWLPISVVSQFDSGVMLAHLQAGGMAPVNPGPGGIGEDGVPLPGNPEPWSYAGLTSQNMLAYIKRGATRAQVPPVSLEPQVLLELEYREVQRLPPATVALFVSHADILLDPATSALDNASVDDIIGIPDEPAPPQLPAFTPY